MERFQLLEMVTRLRRALEECESRKAAQAEQIALFRMAGKATAQLEALLSAIEAECDRYMAEMEKLLDELDNLEIT